MTIRRSDLPTNRSFELDVWPDRERVFVSPRGEVDMASYRELEQTAVGLIERGFSSVVVDLRGVTFLDSSGIRALVTIDNRARGVGAEMKVILGPPASRLALETSGIIDCLNVEAPSQDGSLSSY